MISTFTHLADQFSNFLWNSLVLWLLLGTGIFLTIRLGFVQFKHIPQIFGTLIRSRKTVSGGISSFQSLCTTMAARVGTGNIVGIATALYMGGPGAIFWMWVTALIGMATSFSESVLAQVFRIKLKDGQFRGGPAYYIERGLRSRPLGILFAFLLIAALGLVFNALQTNSIATALQYNFEINTLFTGICVATATALIIFGGFKRIARISELSMPFIAGGYILFALIVLITHYQQIPDTLRLIFSSAFNFEAASGAFLGYSIKEAFRYGVARGLFSNEAGMGTSPNASATADVKHPVDQGFMEMTGVFIDTMFVCTSSAAIVLFSNVYDGKNSQLGVGLMQDAMDALVGPWGPSLICVAIFFFAFTTIFANCFYAEMNIRFIFKRNPLPAILTYRAILMGFIIFGAINSVQLIWTLADIGMGLMTLLNLCAIILLRKYIIQAVADYKKQQASGVIKPTYTPGVSIPDVPHTEQHSFDVQ